MLSLVVCVAALAWACTPQPTSENQSQVTNPSPVDEVVFGYQTAGLRVVNSVVKRNENLSEILSRFHIPMGKVAELAQSSGDIFDVKKIQADRPYTIICSDDSLQMARCFIYQPNAVEYVAVEFGDSLVVRRVQRKIDTLKHSLSGVIESSLYMSIVNAGGSPALVNALADIYAWEIDFFGLQTGDQYRVFYTTYAVDGVAAGFGDVLSASFQHLGKELLAFRYDQQDGHGTEYFDAEGNSLRKTFLKAPLSYTRISSRFSYSRLHPVLKIRRPHLGVDYAAPMGTPIVAVGDGVVTQVGWAGGGGKTIRIKHNSNYETAYLHLSRYGEGITVGKRISQGHVIGYVGSTGLSTGPHLDFRFYKNGTPVDPLTVDAPSAEPISENNHADFIAHRNLLIQIMEDLHWLEAKTELLAHEKATVAPPDALPEEG